MMRTGQARALRGRHRVAAGLAEPRVGQAVLIAAVARRCDVVVSAAAAESPHDWLPAGAGLTDLGVHRLNGAGQPERIFLPRAERMPEASRRGRWATRRC